MATFIYCGVNIYVGRDAKQNWELLENANDNDIWIHLDKLPSCYVIIDSKSGYSGAGRGVYKKYKNKNFIY